MVYYKRNLPHYQDFGFAYFITTRLVGTIPKNIYQEINSEYQKRLDYISGATSILKRKQLYKELQLNRFIKYEKILDSAKYGKNWLRIEVVADKISSHLLKYDGTRYSLIAFTIMPNHLHIILIPIDDSQLEREKSKNKNDKISEGTKVLRIKKNSLEPSITRIMRLFKGATANECNKILNRKGQFWQNESYDHQIRDEKEMKRS